VSTNSPTSRPKLSVIVITYNHSQFLRLTLDSVLAQQVDFDVEVIVSDDCSTDGTQDIIRAYHARYPTQIVPLLHAQNLGGFGKNNTLAALAACRGEYIAALDGDDYWTDPLKLQKQVDFLEKNTNYSACFHNAQITYDDDLLPPELVNPSDQKAVVTDEDMVGTDEIWFIATSACVFRNGILRDYPKWFHESKSGDIPRYVLLAKWGPIGYLNEVMSVYRKNGAGLSFTDSKFDAEYIRNRIGMFMGIDAEYEYRFHHKMRYALAKYYLFLANCKGVKGTWPSEAYYALKSLRLSRPNTASHLKTTLLAHLIPVVLQDLYSFLKWNTERLFTKKSVSNNEKAHE
jgi:glycosyltransferase involved in cell wall biosynthesis